ncbi:GTPase ObgE [Erysipelothrix urinaevulpis]|uniref:GTPase ObgE n=1 Tax=Erysipelothrix urinaevulpis TaxID=2683717 RepID=UPI00135BB37C|nr:GTPase ObgE [Erysipelothrix urinaevulpis]
MFVDKIEIEVVSGNGGNGLISFRKEAHVPLGGPYGGDGGRGGDVIFEADSHKSTLLDLRYNKILKASGGDHGKTKKMHGRSGQDLVLHVPVGTVVTELESGVVIADLTKHGQREIIAKGGKGGRGNARFATPNNPAPHFSEKGELGEAKKLRVELKLLAEVGLIGFPSVGKSTLLSVITRAKPEIAEYPFTTISPNLGIVETNDHRSFAVADLPGLIEDAHEGKGLGHVFLKHIERCRVLVHVLDMGGEYGRDPLDDYDVINNELEKYNPDLLKKPMVVAANKMDMEDASNNLERFKVKHPTIEVFELITLVNEGTDQLLYRLADILDENKEEIVEEQHETVVFKYHAPQQEFDVIQINSDTWRLEGPAVAKLFRQFDFDSEESVIQFGLALKRLGVDQELRNKGARDGHTVILENVQFVFDEGMVE